MRTVMAATDRSETAERAARWAADLAAAFGADLLLLQVLPMATIAGADHEALTQADEALRHTATELAGPRGRARVVRAADPAQAVLDAIEVEQVDVVVVGNIGMRGRKEFLLGNVPNRISHHARCTVIIVNTGEASETQASAYPRPGTRGEGTQRVEGRLFGRAWRIGRVLIRAGALDLLRGTPPQDEATVRARAQRFRAALDELGPTFAKLGQLLSTRPDLLPPAFVEELATLQERVTPLAEVEVVAVMEQELGVPWEDVFAAFDPVPLAAGTIAQVHRATLESGERVVVKVQRPTAARDIYQDLGLLELLAKRAAARPALRQALDVPALIEHLSTALRRELDFGQEAANLARMRAILAPFSRLGVPVVYPRYSTARLLVMQEIRGGPVGEAPEGMARREVARQLVEAYYQQLLVEGYFHADPHPGNLKWWNDAIYFLDLGMVGEIDVEARGLILLLVLAFAQRDAAFLAEVVLLLSEGDRRTQVDVAAFRGDLERLIAQYRDQPLRDLPFGPMLREIGTIALRHGVRVPGALLLVGKAMAQLQLVAGELDPLLDPFAVAESFVLRAAIRRLARGADPRSLFYGAQKARLRLSRALTALEAAAGARPGASLRVDFAGTERIEEAIALASRRLSLGLGLGGALIGAAMTATSPRAPRWSPYMMGGLGCALAAGLLVDRPRRK